MNLIFLYMSNINEPKEFDYLNFCKEYIKIDINNSQFNDDPQDTKMPCGNIGLMVGTLTYLIWVVKKNDRQIIEYINQNNFSFILKRNTIKCDLHVESILSDVKMRRFINSAAKEFLITKIISHHPAGIQAFDFKITYFQQKHCLVTEFLMEKGGSTLTEYMSKPAINVDFVKYFTQLSSLMQHLEEIQIFYNNLSIRKCLVDPNGNFRIASSEVSNAEGYFSRDTIVTTRNNLGFINGYVPPEIYNQYEEARKNNKKPSFQNILPWRANTYSCGILGLCISGAISPIERSNISDLDIYKVNSQEHQFIINKCKLVKCSEESLSEKMQYVFEVCLSFDPMMRITFNQLHTILTEIQKKDYDLMKLQQDVEFYRKENQSKLLKKDLIQELNEASQTNQKLHEEVKHLREKSIETLKLLEIKEKELEKIWIIYLDLVKLIENQKDIINKNESVKAELLNNFKNSIRTFNPYLTIQLRDISEFIPLFHRILEEKKELEKENKVLKEKIIMAEESLPIKEKEVPLALANVKSCKKEKLPKEIIVIKQFRKEIQEIISNPKVWNFAYFHIELTPNEILGILTLGMQSEKLKWILFSRKQNFDEKCGEVYKTFILNNNSLLGIDLAFLNFSIIRKLDIIFLAIMQKANIKVAIIGRKEISSEHAQSFTEDLKLEISKMYIT